MTRPEIPDRPMTLAEVSAANRGQLAVLRRTFYFAERVYRTDLVTVEAVDEDEAWAIYVAEQDGTDPLYLRRSTLYEDEVGDANLLHPGDYGYPGEATP